MKSFRERERVFILPLSYIWKQTSKGPPTKGFQLWKGERDERKCVIQNRKQNTHVSFSKSKWTYALLGLHDFILKVSQDKAFAFLRENSFLILNNFWILSADFNGKSLQKVGGEWKDLDSPGADFVSEIVPWARTSDFPSIFHCFRHIYLNL